jgi:hypothetical protein
MELRKKDKGTEMLLGDGGILFGGLAGYSGEEINLTCPREDSRRLPEINTRN